MEALLLEILDHLKKTGQLDDKLLAKIIHKHNKTQDKSQRPYSKKMLLPFYLKTIESDKCHPEIRNIDKETEKKLIKALQVKPRRTASGVATITVITKPWKCSSDCLYCPNDLRMPKSYLSDEPACQRAERNYFDPYLQVVSRLRALNQMGHPTDKIELIVLGGTWSDYPQGYQIWFVAQLFKALNDDDTREQSAKQQRKLYKAAGINATEDALQEFVREKQAEVNAGALSYNKAMAQLYDNDSAWGKVSSDQVADFNELENQQIINENATHRVVGLVIETRPDTITPQNLTTIRKLGCTKVQIGIQSVNTSILKANNRSISIDKIKEAFLLLRLFGFKIHAHFMLNLYGSSPEKDKEDYLAFVTDKAFLPDEVKLYPCSLVHGTRLCEYFENGSWRPYTEEELLDVLIADTHATPPYVRISRMIRDISAHDIVAGNKKANLRQLVEQNMLNQGIPITEIRYREINKEETSINELKLDIFPYKTSVTQEYFLQWITPQNKIAGFLRLSLPDPDFVSKNQSDLPIKPHEAMIREVHVYGKAAKLHTSGEGAQHLGLGKDLINTANEIALREGYPTVNVISSVGTRHYYRGLGFSDNGLYQQKSLD